MKKNFRNSGTLELDPGSKFSVTEENENDYGKPELVHKPKSDIYSA